jgi:hypothetical protein
VVKAPVRFGSARRSRPFAPSSSHRNLSIRRIAGDLVALERHEVTRTKSEGCTQLAGRAAVNEIDADGAPAGVGSLQARLRRAPTASRRSPLAPRA